MRGVVNPLGVFVPVFAHVEIGAFDKFDRELLIVADEAQRFLGCAYDSRDHFGTLGDDSLRRGEASLNGAVNVGARGDLSIAFVLGDEVLRHLQHGRVDGARLQGDVGHVARPQGEHGDLIQRNLINEKNLPGENFGKRAGSGDAELLAAHLLYAGDARQSDHVEGRLIG